MDICYVYHVIGTLRWEHIELSLESLSRQDIRWKRFVLYNGGEFPDSLILSLVPNKFDDVEVFPYDPDTPKSAIADWDVQMKGISGYESYFVHKADFYLADRVCKAFEEVRPDLVLFHKFDMKEWARPEHFRDYATRTFDENLALPATGDYQSNYGKLAIRFEQGLDGVDGTMHGYADHVRGLFSPSPGEIANPWDVAGSMQRLAQEVGHSGDKRFFAMHMWHPVPQKNDPQKLFPGEGF